MPPFTFLDTVKFTTTKSWLRAWFTRFLSHTTNFGSPCSLPSSFPPQISSLALLPDKGLLMAAPLYGVIFLYSFSDGTTSIYAGSGLKGTKLGHRSKIELLQPSILCTIADRSLLVLQKHRKSLLSISCDGKVDRIRYTDSNNRKLDIIAQSIASTSKGGIFVISHDGSCFSMNSTGREATLMDYGNFVGEPVISPSSRLLPLANGRNIVCGSTGLFCLLQNGHFEPIVTAKVLGFCPVDAIELLPTLFLISDSYTSYIVDISDLDSGNVVMKPLSEVIGTAENTEAIDALAGPFCFDHSSGTIWSVKSTQYEAYLVSFDLLEVVERMNICVDIQRSSEPSPASRLPSHMSNSINVPEKDGNDKFTQQLVVKAGPSLELSSGRPSTPSKLAVSPNGHIIKAQNSDLLWFDPKIGSFKPLAGCNTESGFWDGDRLLSRFSDIGSILFSPHLDRASEKPSVTPIRSTSQPKHQATVSLPSSEATYSNYRHLEKKEGILWKKDEKGVHYPHASYPNPERPKSFLHHLLGSSHRMFISDTPNHRIRELNLTGMVTTYAGSECGTLDGPLDKATFSYPSLMTAGKHGEIFVGSGISFCIRRISQDGIVTTLDCDFRKAIGSVFGAHSSIFQSYPSFSSFASNNHTGHLMLAYQSVLFLASPSEAYERYCDEETGREDSVGHSSSIATTKCLPLPKDCFSLSVWSGTPSSALHQDGIRQRARFEGALVSVAVLPEFLSFESFLLPTYMANHHLMALDSGDSSIRCIHHVTVTSAAGSSSARLWLREGRAGISHLPMLDCIAPFSPRSVVAVDIFNNVSLVSDAIVGSEEFFRVWTGFRHFLPPSQNLANSGSHKTGKSIHHNNDPSIQSPPTTAFSDFNLSMFGCSWALHQAILELRAPGLLSTEVVHRLEERKWINKKDMEDLLNAVYLDEFIRKPPPEARSALTALGKRYSAALDIGCLQWTECIEEQIRDFFRLSDMSNANYPSSQESLGFESLSAPAIDAESSQDSKAPHGTIEMLGLISSISILGSDVAAVKILSLFMPYMVANYPGVEGKLEASEIATALNNVPDMVSLVFDSLQHNRFELPRVFPVHYHEAWASQWRSLLVAHDKATFLENKDVSFSGNQFLFMTSLKPDFEIHGSKTIWQVHRWILAAKCPYFEALFSSRFNDAFSPSWQAPSSSHDPGFLSDSSLGALLDYIYTDNPTLVLELDETQRQETLDALPFYFIQDTPHHLCGTQLGH